MPGTLMMQKVRMGLTREALQAVAGDSDLSEMLARPRSLGEVAERLLDLEDWELAYLRDFPERVQEAIRAVIHDVVSHPDENLELELYYTPAYEFAVTIHEFDRSVVIHVQGPYTGQPSAREVYKGSR